MKKELYVVLAATLLSCGGGGSRTELEDALALGELRQKINDQPKIGEKEYQLDTLLKMHSALENKNEWNGEEVQFWFIATRDASDDAKSNDSTTYAFTYDLDKPLSEGKDIIYLSMYCDPKFYLENPELKFKEGDKIHATGTFRYNLFNEPDIDRVVPVKF